MKKNQIISLSLLTTALGFATFVIGGTKTMSHTVFYATDHKAEFEALRESDLWLQVNENERITINKLLDTDNLLTNADLQNFENVRHLLANLNN